MIRAAIILAVGGAAAWWWFNRAPAGTVTVHDVTPEEKPWYDFFAPPNPVAVVESSLALPSVGGGGGKVGTQSRGLRNNNPGNIKWSSANNWVGQTGRDDAGFVIFDKPDNGVRALSRVLDSYERAGVNTIDAIVRRYTAGDSQLAQANYSAFLQSRLGVAGNFVLNKFLHRYPLIAGIIQFENGSNPFTKSQIERWMALP